MKIDPRDKTKLFIALISVNSIEKSSRKNNKIIGRPSKKFKCAFLK